MADSASDTIENKDSEIKEMELNEESTGFDVSESESPLAISDQSSSCPSSEQNAQTDTPSASVDESIQSIDKPASKVSDSGSSDCSGSILPESSNLSTAGDANIDETQISINSSISQVKHFTSSISPDQADASTSGVLKSGSGNSVDSISQPGYGLSTSAEEFQAILTSCLEESESKHEGESSGVQAENPLERMTDSSTEDETQNSEAVLIPGGSKKKKYTTLSIRDITSMVIKKTLHASSESSSSCSSPIDDKYRRKAFQRLQESVDSSSRTASPSMDSTSSESSLSDEARKDIRDRSDSYEKAVTIGRWHQYVKERKEREEKPDTEENSGPAKRPALERKDKDDDEPPTPGIPPFPIPPQERLI